MNKKSSFLLLLFLFSPMAYGVDLATLFNFGAPKNSTDYTVHYAPSSHGGSPQGTPSFFDNSVRGHFVVAKNDRDTWSFLQKVANTHLSFSPVIPGTGVIVPDSLWDIEAGGIFRRNLGDRRDWAVNFSLGSAGDEPFYGTPETTLRLGATTSLPSGPNNAWLFSLNYSNNRYFANNIPLPGVAYLIRSPSKGLDFLIGFPLVFLSYRPTKKLYGRVLVFGPQNMGAEAGYFIVGPLKLYSRFDLNQQSWIRSDRDVRANRLFYEQKKWTLGVGMPVLKSLSMDFSGGYEYGRSFYEAESALKHGISKAQLNSAVSGQLKFVYFLGTKSPGNR
jgi:hypothetical protein